MKTMRWFLAGVAAISLGSLAMAAGQAGQTALAAPTYTKDVAPILFKNCTSCHRPGEIAPMSLLTYEDVRPYAKAIRDEVGDGHMPPWHADGPDRDVPERARADRGRKEDATCVGERRAPKGDPKDLPPTPVYPEGWAIGKPDVVFEMKEDYAVPADGTIEYEYFYIPTNFTEPKWIKAIELRPGNREVVHHVLVFYRATPDLKRPPVLQVEPDADGAAAATETGQPAAAPQDGRRAGSSRPTRPARIRRSCLPEPPFGSSPAA